MNQTLSQLFYFVFRNSYANFTLLVDIDYCQGVVCQNNGVCEEIPPGARCNCLPQYKGLKCESMCQY